MTDGSSNKGEAYNVLHLLFTALAGICFLSAVGILLYELWGLLSGNGWQQIKIAQLFERLFGKVVLPWQVETLLLLAPLDISLMGIAWVLNKISDGFESLS